MVLIGIYRACRGFATLAVPAYLAVVDAFHHKAQFAHFGNEGRDAVGLLHFQSAQPLEVEGDAQACTTHHDGLCQVRLVDEVVV